MTLVSQALKTATMPQDYQNEAGEINAGNIFEKGGKFLGGMVFFTT